MGAYDCDNINDLMYRLYNKRTESKHETEKQGLIPESEREIIDPLDLVRELADKIGIHQLYAITVDLRGEPEQKKGKWILHDKHDGFPIWECSECGGHGRGDFFTVLGVKRI